MYALCQEVQSNATLDEVWTQVWEHCFSVLLWLLCSLLLFPFLLLCFLCPCFSLSLSLPLSLTTELGSWTLHVLFIILSLFQNLTGLVSPPALGWNSSLVTDSDSGCRCLLISGRQLKISVLFQRVDMTETNEPSHCEERQQCIICYILLASLQQHWCQNPNKEAVTIQRCYPS